MGGILDDHDMMVRRSCRVRLAWWILSLIPVALFVSFSYRPVMRLKADPPLGFVEARKGWDAKRLAAEERTARAYWHVATSIVQEHFAFGTTLPDEPVPEFKLDENEFPPGAPEAAPSVRLRYWKKLGEVWPLPQHWEKHYKWSLNWAQEYLVSFSQAIWRFIEDVLHNFGH